MDNLPIKVYAKSGWFRSKEITIDNSTSEVIIKNEKYKNWIAPGIGGLVLLTFLQRKIWEGSPIANTVSIVGLAIIAAWVIYAFLIKRSNWILIDKKSVD